MTVRHWDDAHTADLFPQCFPKSRHDISNKVVYYNTFVVWTRCVLGSGKYVDHSQSSESPDKLPRGILYIKFVPASALRNVMTHRVLALVVWNSQDARHSDSSGRYKMARSFGEDVLVIYGRPSVHYTFDLKVFLIKTKF